MATQATPAIEDPRPPSALAREIPIQYGLALLTVVLVAAPLLPVLYQSLIDRALYDSGQQWTLQNFVRLATANGFLTMLWNTFALAVLTTLVSQALGTIAAILVGRTDVPGQRVLGELFLWPLYVSSLVLSFGWYTIYGPSGYITQFIAQAIGDAPWDIYTLPGMALIAGVSQAPVAYLYCQSSAGMTDPALEEAARIAGAGTFRTLRAVTLPLLKPAIFYSAVLNFTVALEMLAVPLVFGEPAGITVLTTFLYQNGLAAARPDHGVVATAAVILLAVVCALVWLQGRLLGNTRRYVTLGGKATRPRPFRLGPLRWPMFLLFVFYLVAAVLLPLGVLVLRSFVTFLSPLAPISEVLSLSNFLSLLDYPIYLRAIRNTFIVSLVGGVIATLLIALIAIVILRSEFRFRHALQYVALFPRAVPGVIAGMGFFYAVAMLPGVGALRNSIWILVLAFTMHFIPAGYGAVAPMLLQISPDLDRAARVQGADWWTTVTRVVLPLMRPALVACFTILFIAFFKEYTTAVFLFAPGSEIIGTSILQLWVQGEMGQVAALATIQVAIIALCVTTARAVFGVKLYG